MSQRDWVGGVPSDGDEPAARWLVRHHRPLMRLTGVLLILAAFAEPLRLLLK